MTGLPKVSIVIACYNYPNVVKAVESAYRQSYLNKEIILVDDGSNEETKRAIQTVREQINVHIEQENKGQSIARNAGIKRAKGEYILNLDADDFFEESFCEKAVKVFEEEEGVEIVTCIAKRFNESGDIDVFTPCGGKIDNFLYSNSALGSSMFRKKSWEKCGGYEEKLPILGIEDWELYIQLLKDGGSAFVIPEILFHYQVRQNSTTDLIRLARHDKFKHIILKHRELYIKNFETTIDYLIERINKVEIQKEKISKTPDFKVGKAILTPYRTLKKMLKR